MGDDDVCEMENRPRLHLLHLPRHARGPGLAGKAGLPGA